MEKQQTVSGLATTGGGSPIVITKEDIKSEPSSAKSAPMTPPSVTMPVLRQQVECEPVMDPAGFWMRLLAKAMDVMLALAAFFVMVAVSAAIYVFGYLGMGLPVWEEAQEALPGALWAFFVAYLIFYTFYSILTHAAYGRTLGKCICGLQVVTPTGAHSGVGSALLYFLARYLVSMMTIALLGIGHVIAGFRKDKRALHDLVVGSRVVQSRT